VCRPAGRAAAPGPHEFDRHWHGRGDHDDRDHRQQVLVDARNARAEQVTGQGDPGRPADAADDLPEGEGAGGHVQHPGEWVEHGAHHRDEPGQHDRPGLPVAGQQFGGAGRTAVQPLAPGARQQRLPAAPAEPESGLGPDQGTGDRGEQHRSQRQADGRSGAGRAVQPGGEQQRVAGEKEPDQQAGFGEHHHEHAERAKAGQPEGRGHGPGRARSRQERMCRAMQNLHVGSPPCSV
jgi:hypothetical protein